MEILFGDFQAETYKLQLELEGTPSATSRGPGYPAGERGQKRCLQEPSQKGGPRHRRESSQQQEKEGPAVLPGPRCVSHSGRSASPGSEAVLGPPAPQEATAADTTWNPDALALWALPEFLTHRLMSK